MGTLSGLKEGRFDTIALKNVDLDTTVTNIKEDATSTSGSLLTTSNLLNAQLVRFSL